MSLWVVASTWGSIRLRLYLQAALPFFFFWLKSVSLLIIFLPLIESARPWCCRRACPLGVFGCDGGPWQRFVCFLWFRRLEGVWEQLAAPVVPPRGCYVAG